MLVLSVQGPFPGGVWNRICSTVSKNGYQEDFNLGLDPVLPMEDLKLGLDPFLNDCMYYTKRIVDYSRVNAVITVAFCLNIVVER